MNEKDKVDRKVEAFIRSRVGGRNRRSQAVYFDMSDLNKDLKKISDEMIRKVVPTAVGYAGSIVKKQIEKNLKSGGGPKATTLGMSKRTKSREKWSKGPSQEYQKRINSPSMGEKGTIIKKNISRKAYGMMSSQIVGPKHSGNQKDITAKNFAHMYEPKGGGATGAPNHKWWGRDAKRALKPRPFVEPAANQTITQQRQAIVKAMKRWSIDMGEVDGTTGEF
jgi:hypothetical protein